MEYIIRDILLTVCAIGCIARIMLAIHYSRSLRALRSMRKSRNKTMAALKEQFILRYQAMLGVENVDSFVEHFLSEQKYFGISLAAWNGVQLQCISGCLLYGILASLWYVSGKAAGGEAFFSLAYGMGTSLFLIFVDGGCGIGGKHHALKEGMCDYLENYMKVRLEHEYKIWGKFEKEEKNSKAVQEAQLQVADAVLYQKLRKEEKKRRIKEEKDNRRQKAYTARMEKKMEQERKKLERHREKVRKKLGEETIPAYRTKGNYAGLSRARLEAEQLKLELGERRRHKAEEAAADTEGKAEKEGREPGQRNRETAQRQVEELLKDFLLQC